MEYFVQPQSIVRRIWGKSDTVLFIFAGAAAEFALNKSVDWLYFTGKLPADPVGRLFSTVTYAKKIIFSDLHTALAAIDKMGAIHSAVEQKRGASIPAEAYKDVLFMLIHYSIASFEWLERPLTDPEKEEISAVFIRVGRRMGMKALPADFGEWQQQRALHLQQHLVHSHYTADLYAQYKRQLGLWRYKILLNVQHQISPGRVTELLGLKASGYFPRLVALYRWSKQCYLDSWVKWMLLPSQYRAQVKALDHA